MPLVDLVPLNDTDVDESRPVTFGAGHKRGCAAPELLQVDWEFALRAHIGTCFQLLLILAWMLCFHAISRRASSCIGLASANNATSDRLRQRHLILYVCGGELALTCSHPL